MAVVGLERTLYVVSETEGVVEVCAVVRAPTIACPIEFSFNATLSTSDKSAGANIATIYNVEHAAYYRESYNHSLYCYLP